jgi:hypothetical protein
MSDEPVIRNSAGLAASDSHAVGRPALLCFTGREIHWSDECWDSVKEWAKLQSCKQLAAHRLCNELTKALRCARRLDGSQLRCFRGVSHDFTPGPKNMGPPCPKCARSGRYNHDGKSVLYLSTTTKGVALEVGCQPNTWVQSYTLNPGGLRIADLRPTNDNKTNVDILLNHVF